MHKRIVGLNWDPKNMVTMDISLKFQWIQVNLKWHAIYPSIYLSIYLWKIIPLYKNVKKKKKKKLLNRKSSLNYRKGIKRTSISAA